MLTKPTALNEHEVKKAIEVAYRTYVSSLDFMPVGEASWSYRLTTTSKDHWFVKVIQGNRYDPAFVVPAFLSEKLGYDFVVAPKRTVEGDLWTKVRSFTIVLYPYLAGETADNRPLSADQWQKVGQMIHTLHQTAVPRNLRARLWQETFVSRWAQGARAVVTHAIQQQPEGIAGELAAFIRAREEEIDSILLRTEELGGDLKRHSLPYVLCHADPNKANVFVTADRRIVLLDWDDVMLAPKERDLVFFLGGKKEPFLKAYDPERKNKVNSAAIAYYRYDWVVQEINGYGQRVFFSDLNAAEKRHALQELFKLFAPGDVVDVAYEVDPDRRQRGLS